MGDEKNAGRRRRAPRAGGAFCFPPLAACVPLAPAPQPTAAVHTMGFWCWRWRWHCFPSDKLAAAAAAAAAPAARRRRAPLAPSEEVVWGAACHLRLPSARRWVELHRTNRRGGAACALS